MQETGRRFVEGHPEIYVVSNVVQDGVAIGSLGAGEAVWHTDMSYLPEPPPLSEHGPALDVMKRIKQALDPKNIMNPGKIFGDTPWPFEAAPAPAIPVGVPSSLDVDHG